MTMRPSILVVLLVAVLGFGVMVEARRVAAAEAEVARQLSALIGTRETIASIERHEGLRQTVEERRHPENDLGERVLDALASADVDEARFQGVSALGDQTLPDAGDRIERRRQLASMSLDQMTVAEVGRFLAAWRGANTAWHADGLDVRHTTGAGSAARFTMTMRVSAIYIAGSSDSNAEAGS
ncbi:MAG: hypothetical protein ACYTGR_12040 [Planctomycetota bacterium]